MARKNSQSRSGQNGKTAQGTSTRRARSSAKSTARIGADAVDEQASKLAQQARTTMARARKQLDAADRRMSGYIQRNPKAAAAMAAGIGAAVGAAIAAAMRRRR